MSRQSDAKAVQGYVDKPVPATCMHCTHFQHERVNVNAGYPQYAPYYVDKNMRCGLGGFAVKKLATCRLFQRAPAEPTT